jgi:protein O-mannosyl-transferase
MICYWPVALGYLIIGLLAYARILGTFFVADDFVYLDDIAGADSAAVIFSPLAGRYFRPLVVLVYYVNYQLAGLSPWTYHLSVVLMHVVNGWLVFLLGRTIAPDRGPLVPALAGALFLVFGGHAEAVTWIGGMADPLVTLFLLLALLLLHRALDAPRPIPWLVGTWTAFALALLTKELSAVFLGFAVAFTALAGPAWPDSRRMRRAAIALSVAVLMLTAYFVLRKVVLGFTFVDLQGLGTSTNLADAIRAFTVRSFLPHSGPLMRVWSQLLDLYVGLPIVVVLLFFVRRQDWRPLLLLTACFGLALAPVLPLSIAIATPESERLIYLASAFASLLLVWFLDATLRQRWLVTTMVVVWSLGHALALDRINRRWVTAASLTQGITSSFREIVREHGRPGWAVYVLNVPDTVQGTYVYRRGFHNSLRVTDQDQLDRLGGVYVLSVHAVFDASAPVTVSQRDPRTFEIDLGGGQLLGAASPPGPFYAIDGWSGGGFRATFTAAAGPALVVYLSPQETRLAGILPDSRIPFGS